MKPVEKTQGDIIATIRDVTVTFDGYQTRSLAHLNLDARRGEILGIVGSKGAGKSTVLRLLAGRLRPTEGKVKVFNRSPRGPTKARIGYVPGKTGPNKPAGFFARLFARKSTLQPFNASTLQPARAMLTQAVLGSRDLVILDDAFTGLPQQEMAELKTLLRDLAGRGKTVIVSSRVLTDVKDVCDRLAVLHEGHLQANGDLNELLAAPRAIHFLAPILPEPLAARVAEILREELAGEISTRTAEQRTQPVAPHPDARQKIQPAPTGPADHPLESLTKATAPQQPSKHPGPADDIDHQKLAGLTKPTDNSSKK